MPLFGGGKRQAESDALRAEVERLSALSLQQLASEVMTKGFGTGGPAADGPAHLQNVAGAFSPVTSALAARYSEDSQLLASVVAEGVQVLEHASLVRWIFSGGDTSEMFWTKTRYGQDALDQNAVERVLGGGTL
jgi:hypothetical protein